MPETRTPETTMSVPAPSPPAPLPPVPAEGAGVAAVTEVLGAGRPTGQTAADAALASELEADLAAFESELAALDRTGHPSG